MEPSILSLCSNATSPISGEVGPPGRSAPLVDIDLNRRFGLLKAEIDDDYAVSSHEDISSRRSIDDTKTRIAVIYENVLARICLMRGLVSAEADFVTEVHDSVDTWRQAHGPVSILLCVTGRADKLAVHRDIDVVMQLRLVNLMMISDLRRSG